MGFPWRCQSGANTLSSVRRPARMQGQGRGWATPSPREDPIATTGPPEEEWVASGSNLSPGSRQDQKVPGFRGPAGGRTAPEGLFHMQEDKINDVGARRQKTWAPRIRAGLSLGRWRCQRTTSTFSPKDDSDSTWAHLEENQPCRLLTRREGFLPAKNPSTSFSGCPRAPPWPIKGGPWPPRRKEEEKKGQTRTQARHKQEDRKLSKQIALV